MPSGWIRIRVEGGNVAENYLGVGGRLDDLCADEDGDVGGANDGSSDVGTDASVVASVAGADGGDEEAASVKDLEAALRYDFFRFWRKRYLN